MCPITDFLENFKLIATYAKQQLETKQSPRQEKNRQISNNIIQMTKQAATYHSVSHTAYAMQVKYVNHNQVLKYTLIASENSM